MAIIAPANLRRAWWRVAANRGGPGVDGVTCAIFSEGRRARLDALHDDLVNGAYRPSPVRRVGIPKTDGGTRFLGIPTVADRIVAQAVAQALMPVWESDFSPLSFAYLPGRSAADAVLAAQCPLAAGNRWVIDLDIEAFFDRVDQVRLLLRLQTRIDDALVLDLIGDLLRSGYQDAEGFHPTPRGLAQGSPLSPLLANVVLDELDQELARREWPFVRYADDCLVFAPDQESATRRLADIVGFLHDRLGLEVNAAKTRIAPPEGTSFLGFTYRLGRYSGVRRRTTARAAAACRQELGRLATPQPGDECWEDVAARVAAYHRGWEAYFRLGDLETLEAVRWHARCVIRSAAWRLWNSPARRQLELEDRGVPEPDAEQAAFALTFPNEVSFPAELDRALPDAVFARFGLAKFAPRPPARRGTEEPLERRMAEERAAWLRRIGGRLHVGVWPPTDRMEAGKNGVVSPEALQKGPLQCQLP